MTPAELAASKLLNSCFGCKDLLSHHDPTNTTACLCGNAFSFKFLENIPNSPEGSKNMRCSHYETELQK